MGVELVKDDVSSPTSGTAAEVKVSINVSRTEVRGSGPRLPREIVVLVNAKRLISFFKNRERPNSSRGWAGAAAAKQVAESSVDSSPSEAAINTGVLRIMAGRYGNIIDGKTCITKMEWYRT